MPLPTPDDIANAVNHAAEDPNHQEVLWALGGAVVVTASIVAVVATFGAASVALSTILRAAATALSVQPHLSSKLMDLLETIFDFLAENTENIAEETGNVASAASQGASESGQQALRTAGRAGQWIGGVFGETTGAEQNVAKLGRLAGKTSNHVGRMSAWVVKQSRIVKG